MLAPGSYGDVGRREATLGIVSTTAERRFDYYAGLGLEKWGSHQNALGAYQLGERFLFQPQGQDTQSSPAGAVERARHRSAQEHSAGTIGAQGGLGFSIQEVYIGSHRTERDRAYVPKACSKARNPRCLEAVLRPPHIWYGGNGGDEESGTGQRSHGAREPGYDNGLSPPRDVSDQSGH